MFNDLFFEPTEQFTGVTGAVVFTFASTHYGAFSALSLLPKMNVMRELCDSTRSRTSRFSIFAV